MQKVSIGCKGRAKVSILQGGEVIQEGPWQRNLLLDRGLDRMAEVPICELFAVAVKGTGTTPTKETVDVANSYSLPNGSSTLARTVGTARDFSAADVGRLIKFVTGGAEVKIVSFTDASTVEVSPANSSGGAYAGDILIYHVEQTGMVAESGRTLTYSMVAGENKTTTGTGATKHVRTFKRTFVFDPEAESKEVVTGTYSRSGTTVTRASGSRDFTPADVGKILRFTTVGTEVKITAFTDASNVTVAASGTIAAQSVILYGFTDYTEIGFSDASAVANNLNIRVLLNTPTRAYGATADNPAQQVKVSYEFELTVSPNSIQPSGSTYAVFPINDPDGVMSGNKQGQFVIENFFTSEVASNGDTSVANAILDPSEAGNCAISRDTTALAALEGPIRENAVATKPFEPDTYTPGSFERSYTATFLISEGVASNWRSFMLYNEDNGLSAFTWLFRNNQNKPGTHSMTLTLTKTWGRDLN